MFVEMPVKYYTLYIPRLNVAPVPSGDITAVVQPEGGAGAIFNRYFNNKYKCKKSIVDKKYFFRADQDLAEVLLSGFRFRDAQGISQDI